MTHKKFAITKQKSIRIQKNLDKITKLEETENLTNWQKLILDRAKEGLKNLQKQVNKIIKRYID